MSQLPLNVSEEDTEWTVSFVGNFNQNILVCNESEWLDLLSNDPILVKVKEYILSKWPPIRNLPSDLKTYVQISDELCIENGFVLRGDLLIPPTKVRKSY